MKGPKTLRPLAAVRYLAWPAIILAIVGATIAMVILTRRESVDAFSKAKSQALAKTVKEAEVTPRIKKLCFERGDWIYLTDLSTQKQTKLIKGSWPDLSPTGTALVFISTSGEGNDAGRIKVYDLNSNQTNDLSAIASLRAFGPRWSNDGTKIAFQVINANADRLDIGVLDLSSGSWKNITATVDLGSPAKAVTLDSWVAGNQSILFHSLEDLYEVSIDGVLLQKTAISTFCSSDSISSATRFSLSSDRRYLLFDRDVDTAEAPQNEIISVFDFQAKFLSRITPNTIEARTPVWLPSDKEVLFTCLERFAHPYRPRLCTIAVDGTGLTIVVSDADHGSYSTK